MGAEYSHRLLFTQALCALPVHSNALPNLGMTAHYLTAPEIRRANLKALIDEAGNQRLLSDIVDVAPAQISQWATAAPNSKTKTPRVISDESARQLEKKMGRPRGWMDHDHTRDPTPASTQPAAPSLAQALPVVLADLAALPPTRWASVRAQLDLLAGHPEMRDDVLAELQHLLAAPAAPSAKRQA